MTDPARRLSSFDTSYRSVLPSAVTRPRGPRPRQGCATSCLYEANYSIECRVGYYSHRFGRRKGTLLSTTQLNLATASIALLPSSDALLDAAADTHHAGRPPDAEHGARAGPRLLRAGPPQILPKRRQILQLKRKRSARAFSSRLLSASECLASYSALLSSTSLALAVPTSCCPF